MPAYFGDIGKAAADLLGGFQYDKKFSVGAKTSTGVTLTTNGKSKCDGVCGDLKASFSPDKGITIDAGADSGGKLDTTVTLDEICSGLKAAISANIPYKDSGKLALTYTGISGVGIKADTGLRLDPKINANMAAAFGSATVGSCVAYDVSKGALSKYEVAAQYNGGDYTVAAVATDNLSTLKLSYIHKIASDLSVAGMCVHKTCSKSGKSDVSFALGGLKKLDGGASAKAHVCGSGLASLMYTQDLRPKTTGTFCAQFDLKDLDKGAKFGLEIKTKP
eukprot:1185618-Prorocentrum_minimum.AAC.2